MKKVLMVATVAPMIGQFNMNNIQLLQDMGYAVDVACDFKDRSVWTKERIDKFVKQLKDSSVGYYQIDFSRKMTKLGRHIKSYKQLMRLLKENNYNFVHCHTPIASVLSRIAAHKQGVKCIYTAHGFHFYHGAPLMNWILFYPIEKFLSGWTDILITINQEDYKRAKEKFHAKKVEYVPGVGIDLCKFASNANDIDKKRNELGVKSDEILILSVGELNKNKNHEIVIRAIYALDNPKIRYFIVGKGDLKDYLENLIRQLELESQVRLLGFRNDVAELYQASDLFIFPSKREGLSVALMEAMASGLSCIVSDIRGNRDLIDENGGILCNPFIEENFTNAINIIIDNSEKREKWGHYNKNKIGNFTIKKVRKRMKNIYLFSDVKTRIKDERN